jgi:hypothetical protein
MNILDALLAALSGGSLDGLLDALFAFLLAIFNALGGLDALIRLLG